MAISEHASGTRTTGSPPEASFTALGTGADTTDGVFQFFLDISNLANGDTLEVQVLEKVLSSGTARLVFEAVFTNAQDGAKQVGENMPGHIVERIAREATRFNCIGTEAAEELAKN